MYANRTFDVTSGSGKGVSTSRKLALISSVLAILFVFSYLMIQHLSAQMQLVKQQQLSHQATDHSRHSSHNHHDHSYSSAARTSFDSLDASTQHLLDRHGKPLQTAGSEQHQQAHSKRKTRLKTGKSLGSAFSGNSGNSNASMSSMSSTSKNGLSQMAGSSAAAASFMQLLDDIREPVLRYRKDELESDQPDTAILLNVHGFARLRGIHSRAYGRSVYKFLSVPYAKPPIGLLRFAEPVPFQPGASAELDCTRFGAICPQFFDEVLVKTVSPLTLNMSEDCLTLNIWTPKLPIELEESDEMELPTGNSQMQKTVKPNHHWTMLSKKTLDFDDDIESPSANATADGVRKKRAAAHTKKDLLPVMFWIHGGGFSMGSAALDEYDGQVLASYGRVIVVTLNYRVGVFGFFNLDAPEAQGNQGLKDQIMALNWIHKHIKQFGGDPDRVTVFGQSAGAFAVGLHMIAPAGKNLFRRAILQSGSPLVFDQFFANTVNIANALVKQVQCFGPEASGSDSLDDELEDEASDEFSDDGVEPEGKSAGVTTTTSPALAAESEPLHADANEMSTVVNRLNSSNASSLGVAPEATHINLTNAASLNIVKGNLMNIPDTAIPSTITTPGASGNASGTHGVIQCMRTRTMKQLIRAQKQAMQQSTFPFSPNKDAKLMPRMPAELLKQDQLRDWLHENVQQVLLGVNRDEGSLYLHLGMPELFPSDKLLVNLTRLSELRAMLANNLTTGFKVPHAQAQLVAGLLLNNGPEQDTRENLVRKYHQLLADLMFNCPSVLLADELAKGKRGSKPRKVFFYRFNERPTVTNWGDWMGVTHHEEVQFVFGLPLRYPLRYALKDQIMSKRIIRTWSHFARTGEMLPQLGLEWPLYDDRQQLMELGAFESRISEKLHEKNCNLFRIGFETFMRRRRKRFIQTR